MQYTDLHYFDKSGYEIPITYLSNFRVVIPGKYGDDAVFYGVSDPDGTYTFLKKSSGSRFENAQTMTGHVYIGDTSVVANIPVTTKLLPSASSYGDSSNYVIDSIGMPVIDSELLAKAGFPSTTFTASLTFDKISTELVETQSVYLLREVFANGKGTFGKISGSESTDIEDWAGRYKIVFFIDNRSQENFRFFTVENDEVVWSNKATIDFSDEEEKGYRVNLGFTASEEGVYEEVMYVCLVDTENEDAISPIGTFTLFAEAIGEDERYRTLFANFGIPDPIKYQEVFANTDDLDAKMDNILLNQNSKKMFLTYTDIFPYVGTYKALVNAVNVLGYTDVFFKEWYKEIGKNNIDKGNIAYDITYGANPDANTINNVTIEERISLKKLNWLSMIYRINKEITDMGTDAKGFPYIETVYGFNNSDIVVKLIALREWLEKYIIGLNCRIIDVSGEGIYFERYKFDTYGTYQESTEWNNEKYLTPMLLNVEDGDMFSQGKGTITVDLGNTSKDVTIEDLATNTLADFCEGYFTEEGTYNAMHPDVTDEDASVFVGGTIESFRELRRYEFKAMSSSKTFVFGKGFIFGTDENNTNSPSVIVTDNVLYFSPYDIYQGKDKNAAFYNLPRIQLERANIRKRSGLWKNSILFSIQPSTDPSVKGSYIIKDTKGSRSTTTDYVTLLPPTYETTYIEESAAVKLYPDKIAAGQDASVIYKIEKDPIVVNGDAETVPYKTYSVNNETYGLRYSSLNPYNMPMFSIIGYQPATKGMKLPYDEEFYLEIFDGKMIFYDEENDRYVYLNFTYDETTKKTEVDVNFVYYSDEFRVTEYYPEGAITPEGEESEEDTDTDTDSHESENEDEPVTISGFAAGEQYPDFLDAYMQNPEDVITHNFIHEMTVANAGEFIVDVYGMDDHNNIYAANCRNTAMIKMSPVDINLVGNYSGPRGITYNGGTVSDLYDKHPVYKLNYLAKGIDVKKDGTDLSLSYPTYSYGPFAPKKGDNLHMLDISDLYRVDAINMVYSATNITGRDNDGDGEDDPVTKGYELVMSRPAYGRYSRVMEAKDTTAMMMMLSESMSENENIPESKDYFDQIKKSNFNFADVYFILYNEITGMPVFQTSAYMLNDKVISNIDSSAKFTGKYRLFINDDSDGAYIWASFINTTKDSLPSYITDMAKSVFGSMEHVSEDSEDAEGGESEEQGQEEEEPTGIQIEDTHSLSTITKYLFSITRSNEGSINVTDGGMTNNEIDSLLSANNWDTFNDISEYNPYDENFDALDSSWGITVPGSNRKVNMLTYSAYVLTKEHKENIARGGIEYVYNGQEDINWATDDFLEQEVETMDASGNMILDEHNNIVTAPVVDAMNVYHIFDYNLESRNTDLSTDIINETVAGVIEALSDTCSITQSTTSQENYTNPVRIKQSVLETLYEHITGAIKNLVEESVYKRMLLVEAPREYRAFKSAVLDIFSYKPIESTDGVFDRSDYIDSIDDRFGRLIYEYYALIDLSDIQDFNDRQEALNKNNACWMCMLAAYYMHLGLMLALKIEEELREAEISVPILARDNENEESIIGQYMLLKSEEFVQIAAKTAIAECMALKLFYAIPSEEIEDELTPDNMVCNGYDALGYDLHELDDEYTQVGGQNSTVSLYFKVLMGFAFKMFKVMSKVWVTKGELHVKDYLDDSDYALNAETTYAIAHSAEGKLYYARTTDLPDDLLNYVGEEKVIQQTDCLEHLLSKKYIKAYIKPAWMSAIEIFAADRAMVETIETSSTASGFGGEMDESVEDEIETADASTQYLYVKYTTGGLGTEFRPGQKIKLIYQNVDKSQYIGQATYEVVGYSILNSYIIIKGSINDMYLDDQSSALWAIIKSPELTQGEDQPELTPATKSMTINYRDPISGRTYITTIPIRAVKITEEEAEEKRGAGVWEFNNEYYMFYHKVYMFRNGAFFPIEIRKPKDSLVNMYISYAHHAFVDYTTKIKDVEETSDGRTKLSLDYNRKNRIFMDFVDDTFSLSMYDFDTERGMCGWMDYDNTEEEETPRIYKKPVYAYETGKVDIPASIPYISISPKLDSADVVGPLIYKWRVYYAPHSDSERTLYLEAYNPVLFLDFDDKGVYDVELSVFDRYGNTATETYRGAYRIV